MSDIKLKEMNQLLACLNSLIDAHQNWACHDPSGTGGNSSGGSTGATGKDGKSLEFNWQGTKLGIRVEGQSVYRYVDLKGDDGVSPHIDPVTGRWFVGTSDTGITASGLRGADGKTPTFQVGTVTTLPAGSSATVSISGTPANPILNLGIPAGIAGDPATNTDEKVKMNASSSQPQYLEDWVDKTTIILDTTKNKLKAVTLDGLQTTVATLNFIKNLDKDIMTYLNRVSNPMQFKASVADDAALQAYPNPQAGDTFIVRSSASNANKTMTFIYNGTDFEPIAETTVSVRDFLVNPLDLAKESTGTLPETRIDPLIARLADVLTKKAYGGSDNATVAQADTLKGMTVSVNDIEDAVSDSHTHSNKTLLDSLSSSGDGTQFLTNKGTYSGIYWVSSTAPANTGLFWIDDSDATAPIMKYHDGKTWIPVSSPSSGTGSAPITVDTEMDDTSMNPVQNKVIKAYIDALIIPEISQAANNAMVEKNDGWFVEDPTEHIDELQDEIRILRKSQYHVNTDLDYLGLQIPATGDVGVNQVIPLIKKLGNLEVMNNRVKLYAGKTYKIDTHISYSSNSGTGHTNWANIKLMWLDETNNVEIGEVRQYSVFDAAYEYNGSSSYLYEATTDCELKLYAKEVFITDRIDPRSNVTITEVGQAIQVDDVTAVNAEEGIEDTPIGTIIPVMGTKSPTHYLICDGTVYNISDYPELADHMRDNFGSINYFGGDGTITFAVPDLRGEFLRGSGSATRNTGAGSAVGVHQDPTKIPWLQYYVNPSNNYGVLVANWTQKTQNQPESCDRIFSGNVYYRDVGNGAGQARAQNYAFFPRPTNTAVLWCIKAQPTYFMKVEGKDIYSPEKHLVGYWYDGKPLWEKTVQIQGGDADQTTSTPHGVENYDIIFTTGNSVFIEYRNGVIVSTSLPFVNGVTTKSDDIGIWIDGTNIRTRAGCNRQSATYYVCVRWTEK